jgi:hypothetical protein
MFQNLNSAVAVIGIDIGKNSFHVVELDDRGAIVLRQKWSRGQVEARLANMPPCLIGMEACVGAHHLSRKLKAFGHDARLMPAKYVRPYSKGQKNDFRDAEAIAVAMFVPLGINSLNSSRRFDSSADDMRLMPVTFPPGRLMLSTSPILTGSPSITKTMGILFVAAFAARADCSPPMVTIPAT